MPMMQQPGYPQQMMQGSPPPGYAQQQPQPNWQTAQNQPAIQAGRSVVANDRLPAYPDMLRRPAATMPPQEQRQPIVRGGAPEQTAMQSRPTPPAQSSPGWTPIRIPTPNEMGIVTGERKQTLVPATIALPDRYDLSTVTTWLDHQCARSCQREKLAEGIQFVCSFGTGTPAITVRGNTDEEALQRLVQEVVKRKQELTLSQR